MTDFIQFYACSNECAKCKKSPLTNYEKKLNGMLCNKCFNEKPNLREDKQ